MQDFQFLAASTPEDVVSMLKQNNALVVAGGTDIIPRLRRGLLGLDYLIDISKLKDLNYISLQDGEIHIGATTRFKDIVSSELLNKNAFPLVEAAKTIGCPQTRNRATIAGNLANASPAADSAPPLLVLDAYLIVLGSQGTREIPLETFFLAPGKTGLAADEFILEIRFKEKKKRNAQSFRKLGKRKGMAISIANCATYLEVDRSNQIATAKVALGSVAPTPKRINAIEMYLNGKELSIDLIKVAAELVAKEISPITDIRATAEYRRKSAVVLTERCLIDCYTKLQEQTS